MIPFRTGDTVSEVTGNLERGGSQRLVKVVRHDDQSCETESGHIYTRDTGRCIDKIDTYRAIHTPDYEK